MVVVVVVLDLGGHATLPPHRVRRASRPARDGAAQAEAQADGDAGGDGADGEADGKGGAVMAKKRQTVRDIAEATADAYRSDVVTGHAPGLTLADLIENALEEASEAAVAEEREACAVLLEQYDGCPFKDRRCEDCPAAQTDDDMACLAAAIRARGGEAING